MKIDSETALLTVCAGGAIILGSVTPIQPAFAFIGLFFEGVFGGWLLLGDHSILAQYIFKGSKNVAQ